MSLRTQAEADLAVTLEAQGDYGQLITLTDPLGFTGNLPIYAQTGDVAILIDPDTGVAVTGRLANATVRISTLTAAGYTSIPEGIADTALKPWKVSFAGPSTPVQLYKVKRAYPDRTLGIVVMVLEFLRLT